MDFQNNVTEHKNDNCLDKVLAPSNIHFKKKQPGGRTLNADFHYHRWLHEFVVDLLAVVPEYLCCFRHVRERDLFKRNIFIKEYGLKS